MEKNMDNEMETGAIKGLYRDPSIQVILTLGAKVCKYFLHGLSGSLGYVPGWVWGVWLRV